MIKREDMLELTRRMTTSRTSFTRIAGSYVDADGYIDGTFNTNFLNLSTRDKQRNLDVAKAIPFSDTNENLKSYPFRHNGKVGGSMWQLLQEMRSCGLKNDALMETFYELIAEHYQTKEEYAVLVFHDRYDVPMKGTDKERIGESEEVYEYLICAICPLVGEYEYESPDCGFLYPMFTNRSSDGNHIGIYHRQIQKPHKEIEKLLLDSIYVFLSTQSMKSETESFLIYCDAYI